MFFDFQARGRDNLRHCNLLSVQALKVNASNKQAKTMADRCARKIREQDEKERKMYAGMFDKFARQDKVSVGFRKICIFQTLLLANET